GRAPRRAARPPGRARGRPRRPNLMARLRVAFVTPRYGVEVPGGAEQHARQVAERLVADVEVEVFTSCALHYERWANHYPQGRDEVNGVPVRRFPTTLERGPSEFAAFTDRTIGQPRHSAMDELQWLLLQGPSVPVLVDAVRDARNEFDLF